LRTYSDQPLAVFSITTHQGETHDQRERERKRKSERAREKLMSRERAERQKDRQIDAHTLNFIDAPTRQLGNTPHRKKRGI